MTNNERDQIIRYRNQGLGYAKIAELVGLTKNTVKSFCQRNNLGGVACDSDEHHCEYCTQPIQQTPGKRKKRFCSDKCRSKWWHEHQELVKKKANYVFVCPKCHKEFTAYGNAKRKYCSHACYIADRFGGAA